MVSIVELRHLRYFVAAAEEENLTRAAARLNLSQPPLSRQIRDLEEELGLELFHRDPKSIRLSPAGRVFLKQAYAVLASAEEALRTAKALTAGLKGDFHLGFAPSLTVEILPKALRRFRDVCSGVQPHLYDLSTDEMLEGLGNQSLDAALLIKPQAKDLAGLDFIPLRKNAVCVAAHPSHPFSRRKRVKLEEVAPERLIAYSQSEYPEYHEWLLKLFARRNLTPHIAEEHDGSTSLIASVESGRGVALVQKGFECLAGPRLILRRLSPPPAPFIVGLAYRQDSSNPVVINFRESVERAVAELG